VELFNEESPPKIMNMGVDLEKIAFQLGRKV
jgi:hypothetical protein